MTRCEGHRHEFEFIEKSCGCEYEVCYACPHQVRISTCDWHRSEDSEE
jgi:hypothetical protein